MFLYRMVSFLPNLETSRKKHETRLFVRLCTDRNIIGTGLGLRLKITNTRPPNIQHPTYGDQW